jgi:hypothetical protein
MALLTILQSLEKNPMAQNILVAGVSAETVAQHFAGRYDHRVERQMQRLIDAGFELPD